MSETCVIRVSYADNVNEIDLCTCTAFKLKLDYKHV